MGGSFAPYEFLPSAVRMFSKFTPQYWAIESINTGNIYLAGIVVLFGIALFTAGTFKVRRFEFKRKDDGFRIPSLFLIK